MAMIMTLSVVLYPQFGCSADRLPDPPEIGAAVPNFELPDLQGKTHTLEQYRGKVVVIEMCSQHCPWSRGADPHLVELSKKYADKDVVFVAVDSNKNTSAADIQEYAQGVGKTYAILKDAGNKYADALGARVTPEIYVVDKEGKLRYHGAFDNRVRAEDRGDDAYVDKAVQALLDGAAPTPDRVKPWGCSIKRG